MAETSTQGQQKRKWKQRSDVWEHFTRDHGNDAIVVCNHCQERLSAKHGTSSMRKHIDKSCNRRDGALMRLDDEAARRDKNASGNLAWMIARHGYDPSVLDDDFFRSFVHHINPEFKVPSRRAIEEMCDGEFNMGWLSVMEINRYVKFSLSVGEARTMDQEVSLLYTACNLISDDMGGGRWTLHRKVTDVYLLGDNHGPLLGVPEVSHEHVADRIVSDIPAGSVFMLAWPPLEIRDSVFQHNNLTDRIEIASRSRTSREPIFATYMEHVIHSIARCLLPDSQFRQRMFSAVSDLDLTRQGRQDLLSQHDLDDPLEYNEPWYSCYCSFEVLRKGYSSTISGADFEVIGVLCDVWGKLYHAIKKTSHSPTSRYSMSEYNATSHLCLIELFKLREALRSQLESATGYVVEGLRKAKETLDQAIQDSYMVWSIPLAMDPRYKIDSIDAIFKTSFGSEAAGEYMANVTGKIKDLYTDYADEDDHAIDESVGSMDRLQRALYERRSSGAKTDLDRYLQDTPVPCEEHFDISWWWDFIGSSLYPAVARMAQVALAMPTCSKLSSVQIAKVQSILRGYYKKQVVAIREEEEEEEEEDDDDEENEDDATATADAAVSHVDYEFDDAMIQ